MQRKFHKINNLNFDQHTPEKTNTHINLIQFYLCAIIFYTFIRMIPLTSKLIQISVLCASVTAHITDFIIIPGLKLPAASQLHSHLLHIDTFTDFLYANLYVGYMSFKIYK